MTHGRIKISFGCQIIPINSLNCQTRKREEKESIEREVERSRETRERVLETSWRATHHRVWHLLLLILLCQSKIHRLWASSTFRRGNLSPGIFMLFLLLIPLPQFMRRHVVGMVDKIIFFGLVQSSSFGWSLRFLIVFAMRAVGDSKNRQLARGYAGNWSGHVVNKRDVLMSKWRAERNWWISLFAFTLYVVLHRFRKTVVTQCSGDRTLFSASKPQKRLSEVRQFEKYCSLGEIEARYHARSQTIRVSSCLITSARREIKINVFTSTRYSTRYEL